MYWAVQKNFVKGCREILDSYCISCELLFASIADTLLFVNILESGIFHGRFDWRLVVNKPCLQIIRHLLWKQTTTHSLRNNNPMFDGNLWPNSFDQPSRFSSNVLNFYLRPSRSRSWPGFHHHQKRTHFFLQLKNCRTSFPGSWIFREVRFLGSQISGKSNFREAEFPRKLEVKFPGSQISGKSNFREVKFPGKSNFPGS